MNQQMDKADKVIRHSLFSILTLCLLALTYLGILMPDFLHDSVSHFNLAQAMLITVAYASLVFLCPAAALLLILHWTKILD